MFQEVFEQMGFAQAAPDVWMREFTHPDTGEILRVDLHPRRDGVIQARYTRGGRFVRDKKYWKSPKVAAQAIRRSVTDAGFEL